MPPRLLGLDEGTALVEQPPFPGQRPDGCRVLHDLERAEVVALGAANGEVPDVDEASAHFDPELRHRPLAGLEVGEDPVDHVHAFLRVAVLHGRADDAPGAREDLLAVLVRKIADLVVLVHK
jgi:hypothetical protein